MKKLKEIVANPTVNVFLVGFIISDTIEGRLAITQEARQKNSKTCFEKWDYHLKLISEIHQKLGTLS
jgi:hypothetical protein